jgi:hypothetical protein
VAVVELVDEHVDHRYLAAEVDVAGLAGHRHRRKVALVPLGLEEVHEVLARLAIRGVVDVGEVAVTEPLEPPVQVDVLHKVVVQGQGAHDAQVDALLLCRLGDPLAFFEEDLFGRILVERDVLGQDELCHR